MRDRSSLLNSSAIDRAGAAALAHEAGAARRAGGRGLGLLVFLISARALEAARFTPQAIVIVPRRPGRRVGGARRLPARPAADAQVQRRAGGDVPGGARAVAAGVHHQRARSGRRDSGPPAFAGAGAAPGRRSGPARRATSSTDGASSSAGPALRRDARGGRRRGHRAVHFRSRLPAPRRSALFMLSRDVEAAVPYSIDVKPGNATVARGADQVITARSFRDSTPRMPR